MKFGKEKAIVVIKSKNGKEEQQSEDFGGIRHASGRWLEGRRLVLRRGSLQLEMRPCQACNMDKTWP